MVEKKRVKVAATEPLQSSKQSPRAMGRKAFKLSQRKKTVTIASTEDAPQKQPQPQNDSDDSPFACIDYACETILSIFDSLSGKDKEQKTAHTGSDAPVKVPVKKKQFVVATDSNENKTLQDKARNNAHADAEIIPISQKALSDTNKKDDKTVKMNQKVSAKSNKVSKKVVKAMLTRCFNRGHKKLSLEDDPSSKTATPPSSTKMMHNTQASIPTSPPNPQNAEHDTTVSQPDLIEEVTISEDVQSESSQKVLNTTDKTCIEEQSNHKPTLELETTEASQNNRHTLSTAALQSTMTEETVSTNIPKKVSFNALPQKRAPPSPTAVASGALFELIDAVMGPNRKEKSHLNEANLSAARMVPLPVSDDSDSDMEKDDCSAAESVGESSKQGTFDVVKDMNEMWQKKEEFVSELNEMWEESDGDLVKVISQHISFDEDDEEEPLESDYVLSRCGQPSFQYQTHHAIAAV